MKISSVSWKNFRPFEQENLNFEGMADVVIFTWENGTGKTAFINSIYWCLYGEELTPRRRYIPNGGALKRAFNDKKATLDVSVEVALSGIGGSQKANIKRTKSYRVIGIDEVEPHGPADLTVSLAREDDLGYDLVADPDGWLRANLPKDISKHFLLDGQNFSNFSVNNSAVKDAVAEIAHVSAAEKMAEHLQTVVQELAAAIAPKKLSGEDADRAVREKLRTQKMQNELRVEQLREEVAKWIVENGEPDQFLKDAERAAQLKSELGSLRQTQQQAAQDVTDSGKDLRLLLGSVAPSQLLDRQILDFLSNVSSAKGPGVSLELLEKLVLQSKCICGCDLVEGSPEYGSIHALVTAAREDSGNLHTQNPKQSLRKLREEALKNDGRLMEVWKKLRTAEGDRAVAARDLGEFTRVNSAEGQKRDGDQADPGNANKLYQIVIATQAKLKDLLEETIPGIERDLKALTAAALRENTDDPEARKRKRLAEFAQKCSEAADQVHRSALGNVRADVEKNFTEVYRSMIAEFSSIAQTVELTEDFAVKMYDVDGQERSTGFSTGWGLTAAFAFATALDQLQGYEMPLIVDTPFAATSSNIRRQLVASIVRSLGRGGASSGRQALFLSIDTELTDDVIKEFGKIKTTYVTGRYDTTTQVTTITVDEAEHG